MQVAVGIYPFIRDVCVGVWSADACSGLLLQGCFRRSAVRKDDWDKVERQG